MTYDMLVFIAKTFGLLWMMGFFLVVVVMVATPRIVPAIEAAPAE